MISQIARPRHIYMIRALLAFSHNEACHIADADGCPPQHLHLQPPPTGKRVVIKDIQDLAAYQIQWPSWPQRHSRGHPILGSILGGWCDGNRPQPLGRGGDLRPPSAPASSASAWEPEPPPAARSFASAFANGAPFVGLPSKVATWLKMPSSSLKRAATPPLMIAPCSSQLFLRCSLRSDGIEDGRGTCNKLHC